MMVLKTQRDDLPLRSDVLKAKLLRLRFLLLRSPPCFCSLPEIKGKLSVCTKFSNMWSPGLYCFFKADHQWFLLTTHVGRFLHLEITFELVVLHLKGQCISGKHRNREGQSGDNEGAHRDGEARVKPVRDTAA